MLNIPLLKFALASCPGTKVDISKSSTDSTKNFDIEDDYIIEQGASYNGIPGL
jgi:hypothetical protein